MVVIIGIIVIIFIVIIIRIDRLIRTLHSRTQSKTFKIATSGISRSQGCISVSLGGSRFGQ
eukprot:11908570-Karenia_brevis.AAC.1